MLKTNSLARESAVFWFCRQKSVTYFFPASYSNNRRYYQPEAVCQHKVTPIVISTSREVVTFQKCCNKIYNVTIKLAQRNCQLECVIVWLPCCYCIHSKKAGRSLYYSSDSFYCNYSRISCCIPWVTLAVLFPNFRQVKRRFELVKVWRENKIPFENQMS